MWPTAEYLTVSERAKTAPSPGFRRGSRVRFANGDEFEGEYNEMKQRHEESTRTPARGWR